MIGYEKPIIYLGGEYIGYRVKDNEKLAPDDNELCPVTHVTGQTRLSTFEAEILFS